MGAAEGFRQGTRQGKQIAPARYGSGAIQPLQGQFGHPGAGWRSGLPPEGLSCSVQMLALTCHQERAGVPLDERPPVADGLGLQLIPGLQPPDPGASGPPPGLVERPCRRAGSMLQPAQASVTRQGCGHPFHADGRELPGHEHQFQPRLWPRPGLCHRFGLGLGLGLGLDCDFVFALCFRCGLGCCLNCSGRDAGECCSELLCGTLAEQHDRERR